MSTLGSPLLASDEFSKPKAYFNPWLPNTRLECIHCHSGKAVGLIKDSSSAMEVPASHSGLFCGKAASQNSRIPVLVSNYLAIGFSQNKKKTTKNTTPKSSSICWYPIPSAVNSTEYAILNHEVLSSCTCTSFRASKSQKKHLHYCSKRLKKIRWLKP